MFRFFCPSENISKDRIEIKDKREIRHILNVLKLKKNDEVFVFDGRNSEYRALLEEILPTRLILKIKEKKITLSKEELEITLACAIPKKRRFDLIVEKLTELGVKRIIPLKTARTEVLLDRVKEKNCLSRWQRIAVNSAKQSKRIDVPVIESQVEFGDILNRKKEYDLTVICALHPKAKRIGEILEEIKPKKILILVGPEGDFTVQEVNLALEKGFVPISLGNLILRVETAAIAICSFLRIYAYS